MNWHESRGERSFTSTVITQTLHRPEKPQEEWQEPLTEKILEMSRLQFLSTSSLKSEQCVAWMSHSRGIRQAIWCYVHDMYSCLFSEQMKTIGFEMNFLSDLDYISEDETLKHQRFQVRCFQSHPPSSGKYIKSASQCAALLNRMEMYTKPSQVPFGDVLFIKCVTS